MTGEHETQDKTSKDEQGRAELANELKDSIVEHQPTPEQVAESIKVTEEVRDLLGRIPEEEERMWGKYFYVPGQKERNVTFASRPGEIFDRYTSYAFREIQDDDKTPVILFVVGVKTASQHENKALNQSELYIIRQDGTMKTSKAIVESAGNVTDTALKEAMDAQPQVFRGWVEEEIEKGLRLADEKYPKPEQAADVS